MASLEQIRDGLKATIEAAIPSLHVYDTVPDSANVLPAVIVVPFTSDFEVAMVGGSIHGNSIFGSWCPRVRWISGKMTLTLTCQVREATRSGKRSSITRRSDCRTRTLTYHKCLNMAHVSRRLDIHI